jgi:hypothetical protein
LFWNVTKALRAGTGSAGRYTFTSLIYSDKLVNRVNYKEENYRGNDNN